MASIQGNGSKGHHKFILTINETAISTTSNSSTVEFAFQIAPIQTSWDWYDWNTTTVAYTVTINGTNYTGSIPNYDGYSTVTLKSGSQTITHNADGTKSISYSFSVVDNTGQSYTSGNASASGTLALTHIPRYASITSFSVSKRDETSVLFNWSADATCDYAWYSTDNGSTWNGLPNNNVVGGLGVNTTYNFKLRVRRKDSQLTTDSGTYTQTTYNYPHCTNSHNFLIGDALTLSLYNPLGRGVNVYLELASGKWVGGDYTTGTSISGYVNDAWKSEFYQSIPNAQSGVYKVHIVYGSVTMTRASGNTYHIRGNEVPTINGFDYIDSNETTVALTGNNQHIIQNKSTLQARFHSATPNWWAGGISQYYLECNGRTANGSKEGAYTLGTIDSNRNVELKLTAVDSRGLSASKVITVTMVAYSNPFATVTLQRLNNYEDETYLTVDGSVSSVNSKNTMAIKYRYKQSGGSYGSYVNINDREKYTLSLDKNNAYIFNIVVTDALGSTFSGEFVLEKGVFPLFIDTVLNSVGINGFPTQAKSLEVNGLNVFSVADKVNKAHKNILLGSDVGLKITVKDFGGTDKIALIVAGADNSSMIPVFKIIHIRSGGGWTQLNLGLDSAVSVSGNNIHIASAQWSHFTVQAPLGCEIELTNSAL